MSDHKDDENPRNKPKPKPEPQSGDKPGAPPSGGGND